MQGWPPASDDDRLKGENMGREKRLMEYFQRIESMYRRTNAESKEDASSVSNVQIKRSIQSVTRRGIKVDGKEYWNNDLILGYLGRKVNVVIVPGKIRVEDMNQKIITTFTPITN